MDEVVGVDRKIDISVVLNGGKKEMDTATLPIRWYFSDEVLKQGSLPHYVLVFEQTEEEAHNELHSGRYGSRCAFRTSDVFGVIQLSRPGRHRMMVVSVGGGRIKSLMTTQDYLRENGQRGYVSSLSWERAGDGSLSSYDDRLIAATIVEFEVPKELFAEKPQTRFGKLVWQWANLWCKREPRDECAYRKRRMISLTLKPIPVILYYSVKHFFVGALYALGVFLASLAVLFCGFRPRPILREMWLAFACRRYFKNRIFRFDRVTWISPDFPNRYRLWSIKDSKPRYMKVAPFMVMLWIAGGVAITSFIYLLSTLPSETWIMIGKLFLALFILGSISLIAYKLTDGYLDKTAPARREKKRERVLRKESIKKSRKKQKGARWQQWVESAFSVSHKVDVVELNKLPKPPNRGDRIVQIFRAGYWMLKIKVCRPFSS